MLYGKAIPPREQKAYFFPFIAPAFGPLFDCFAFLQKALPMHKEMWVNQFEPSWISPNSLILHAFQASAILSIELVQPFHICAWQAQLVSILDTAKRDLKAVLAAASMHTAYYHASGSARKDLTASQHCLDDSKHW